MSTDFSSLDRLIEFGFGMGLAQQMVQTMNTTVNHMQIPGVNAGTTGQQLCCQQTPPPAQWYMVADQKVAGPFTDDEIARLVELHKVDADSWVWCYGMKDWEKAADVPLINKYIILQR